MYKSWLLTAILALAIFGGAAGQDTAATVRFHGRPLFRVTPNAGMDANSRAAQIGLATETARTAAQAAEGVLDNPWATVRIEELGADDILVAVQFWADSRRSDYAATTSAVRASVVEALKRAGIGLPEPNVRVLVSRNPDADPELVRHHTPEDPNGWR